MTHNLLQVKSTGQKILENLILALCLCVMSLRATFSEAININAANIWLNINDDLISLIFTSVLLACVLIWLISGILGKSFTYQFTSLEFAMLLFIIAGLIGITVAADKRSAVNDFVTLVVPILTAVVLVQILDRKWKIQLILAVVVALACTSAYQCYNQFFFDTHAMVEQYQADPQGMLETIGIQNGSLEQWLFEHRLYTKGINGFLLTGNSVASFSILATLAALAIFLELLKNNDRKNRNRLYLTVSAFVLFVTFSNFIFVRSKGGSAALILSIIFFVILARFGTFIKKHRKIILLLSVVLIALGSSFVISYGRQHNRLPGGNSMLVRWQYWSAAAKMFLNHRFTGVGPGNFLSYYTQYKTPAAIEAVKDPHNFVLSILTQYGPLGLVAFLTMLFAPLWLFLKSYNNNHEPDKSEKKSPQKTPIIIAVAIAAVLLIVRPILKPLQITDEPLSVILYAAAVLYVMPVIVFAAVFSFTWAVSKTSRLTNLTVCALICGCLGVAMHNLLDFAVFEPAVYTCLWVIIACLIALQYQNNLEPAVTFKIKKPAAIILLFLAVTIAVLFGKFAFIPVANRTAALEKAQKTLKFNLINATQQFIAEAIQKDRLDHRPVLASGKICLQFLDRYGESQKDVLLIAEKSFLIAAQRNPVDYKIYEKLTDTYELLAERSSGKQKSQWLEKALQAASNTAGLYPGLARLRIKKAEIAEQLGKNQIAIDEYSQAVKIEDAFRKQFRIMYPDREIFSRLGNEKYSLAKQKIKSLNSSQTKK